MRQIEQLAFRVDAINVLARMADIMKHPAITEYSYTTDDMKKITRSLEALKSMTVPKTMAQRLINDRLMNDVEDGLYWSVAMLGRNGFQDAKGIAWNDNDLAFAEATLAEQARLTIHQRG